MKPFTIRKQAAPVRAGAGVGDTSMDVSMMSNKYATNATSPLGSQARNAAMMQSPEYAATHFDAEESLLEQADLLRLAEEFPGKVPENPWIKEQTNKQYLSTIKVSSPGSPPLRRLLITYLKAAARLSYFVLHKAATTWLSPLNFALF